MPSINADATLVNTAGRLAATEDKSRGLSDAINTGLNDGYDFTQKIQDDIQKEEKNELAMETQMQANEIAQYEHEQKVKKQEDEDLYANEQWEQLMNNDKFNMSEYMTGIQESNDNVLRGLGKDIKSKDISLSQKKAILEKFSKFTTEIPGWEQEYAKNYLDNATEAEVGSDDWIMYKSITGQDGKGGSKKFNYDGNNGEGSTTYTYLDPSTDPPKEYTVSKNVDAMTGPTSLGDARKTTTLADAAASVGSNRLAFDKSFQQNPKNREDLIRSLDRLKADGDTTNNADDPTPETPWTDDDLWNVVNGAYEANAPKAAPKALTAAQQKQQGYITGVTAEYEGLKRQLQGGNTKALDSSFPDAKVSVKDNILTVKSNPMTEAEIKSKAKKGFNTIIDGVVTPVDEDNYEDLMDHLLTSSEEKTFDLNNSSDVQSVFNTYYESNKGADDIGNASGFYRNVAGYDVTNEGKNLGFNIPEAKKIEGITEDPYADISSNKDEAQKSGISYKGFGPDEVPDQLEKFLKSGGKGTVIPWAVSGPAKTYYDATGQVPYFLINKNSFKTGQGKEAQQARKDSKTLVAEKIKSFNTRKNTLKIQKYSTK